MPLTPDEIIKKFPTRESHPRWDYESAMSLYTALAVKMSQHGWHLAIMGSVVRTRDSGRDLDLITIPWKSGVTRVEALEVIKSVTGATLLAKYDGVLTQSAGFVMQDGRLIDVTFLSGRLPQRFAPELKAEDGQV